jgi:hypothetical protein
VAQTDRSPRDGNNHPAILWIKPIDLQWHDVGTGQRTFGIDRGYRPNKITLIVCVSILWSAATVVN